MIEAVNLTRRFDSIVTVDHMSIAIRDGSIFGFIGTNGTGKSTFLRLVSDVLKPDEGCITIGGHEVFESIPVKKHLFYISDEQYFLNNTAPEEMMHYYREVYQEFGEARLHKLTGNFGLDEGRKIRTFSKGMKKQASVICDVCAGTDYLLYDETFNGLNPVMHQAVKSISAAGMKDRSLTPIIAFHNLRELEDIYDYVGLLHRDGISLSGDLDDMELNIHEIQYVPRLDMKPEDLISLGKVNMGQGGNLCTTMARGSRGEVEAATASYELIFFKYTPLSLEEVFIGGTEVAGYDIRRLIF